MVVSDEYIVERPYRVEDVKHVSGGAGNAIGLDRVKKVVRMETDKIALRSSAKEIDGKMGGGTGVTGKEIRAVSTAASPRKGG